MYRKVDKLGRLVIPKELRMKYGLKTGEVAYFTCMKNGVLITKEKMIQCPNCKTKIDALDNYCSCCGYKIKKEC